MHAQAETTTPDDEGDPSLLDSITPLLIPEGHDDLTKPVFDFGSAPLSAAAKGDQKVLVCGQRHDPFWTEPGAGGPSRTLAKIYDEQGGPILVKAFGDAAPFASYMKSRKGRAVYLRGKLSSFGGQWTLNAPEPIADGWIGRIRPYYSLTVPQQKQLLLETGSPIARESYLYRLFAQSAARARILEQMRSEGPQWAQTIVERFLQNPEVLQGATARSTLDPVDYVHKLLCALHLPESLEFAKNALLVVDRISAYVLVGQVLEQRRKLTEEAASNGGLFSIPEDFQSPEFITDTLAKGIPHPLTDEQLQSATEILQDMTSPDLPMRRMLNGDVGTGKTSVYAVAARAVTQAKGRVAVLLPSEALAKQVHENFVGWFPDLSIDLVLGKARSEKEAQVLIGTTALLHRSTGQIDLTIVDEQHRFSRAQREKLAGRGGHLLEVSATCVPRSQALVEFGLAQVSKLSKCHVQKDIETRLWDATNKKNLFAEIKNTISEGHQVLVVYPAKQSGGAGALTSVSDAEAIWEKAFPEQVVMAHGDRSAEENDAAIAQMKDGSRSILIATTVVEVGLDIAGLRRVVVVQADRFGLSALHQLRGRAARTGGKGWFDLYVPDMGEDTSHLDAKKRKARAKAQDKVRRRLNVLVATQNGFEVASADFQERGCGDLVGGGQQTGDAVSPFLGRALNVKAIEIATRRLTAALNGTDSSN